MPIIDVELVTEPTATSTAGLAQALADAVGGALNSPPGQSWVRLHVLAREHYAENESLVESFDLPVFVTVQKRALPEKAALTVEIAALTSAIAKATGRNPASVHVEYAPAAAGRLAFGGRIVE
jgi:phenylpyruvate tautomerase PptA (4-oxalocrotonate tautomerase family)